MVEINDERLNELVTNIGALVRAVEGISVRLERVENRLTAVEDRLTAVENRLAAVENRLTAVETRVERDNAVLAARLDEQRAFLAALVPVRLAAVPAAE